MAKLFNPQNTVDDVNSAANIFANADEHIKEELYANIKADKFIPKIGIFVKKASGT